MEQKLYIYFNKDKVMESLDLREELHNYVEIGDNQFLDVLYKTAKSYIEQKRLDRMIEEGEEDIKAGRAYSLKEARKMVDG